MLCQCIKWNYNCCVVLQSMQFIYLFRESTNRIMNSLDETRQRLSFAVAQSVKMRSPLFSFPLSIYVCAMVTAIAQCHLHSGDHQNRLSPEGNLAHIFTSRVLPAPASLSIFLTKTFNRAEGWFKNLFEKFISIQPSSITKSTGTVLCYYC